MLTTFFLCHASTTIAPHRSRCPTVYQSIIIRHYITRDSRCQACQVAKAHKLHREPKGRATNTEQLTNCIHYLPTTTPRNQSGTYPIPHSTIAAGLPFPPFFFRPYLALRFWCNLSYLLNSSVRPPSQENHMPVSTAHTLGSLGSQPLHPEPAKYLRVYIQ